MNLPPRAPKEQPSVEQQFAALSRVAQSTATEGAATGGGGSSAASGSRAARGTIASAASTSADSSRGTHTFMLSPHDGDGVSTALPCAALHSTLATPPCPHATLHTHRTPQLARMLMRRHPCLPNQLGNLAAACWLMQISRQMDAHFERRHRECPDLMYGAIFDANWRSLAPAQLQVGAAVCSAHIAA